MRFASLALVAISLFISVNSSPSHAVVEQVIFADQKTEQRYRKLIAELRCLVCQNQNLADSDADLAKDLRRKTAEMLRDGKTDAQVRTYMRDRYGDFVLYKPPFNLTTAFLWLGPFILLVIVIFGIIRHVRQRQEDELLKPLHANNDAQRVKVRNLLKNAPQLDSQDNKSKPKQSKDH